MPRRSPASRALDRDARRTDRTRFRSRQQTVLRSSSRDRERRQAMNLSLFPDISPTLLALTLAVVTGGILLLLLGLALNNPLLLRMGLRNLVRIRAFPQVQAASAIGLYPQSPTVTSLRTGLAVHDVDFYALPPDFEQVYGSLTDALGRAVHIATLHQRRTGVRFAGAGTRRSAWRPGAAGVRREDSDCPGTCAPLQRYRGHDRRGNSGCEARDHSAAVRSTADRPGATQYHLHQEYRRGRPGRYWSWWQS